MLIAFGLAMVCVIALLVLKGLLISSLANADPVALDRFGGPLLLSHRLHFYLLGLESEPGTQLARRLRAYRVFWWVLVCAWLVWTVGVFRSMR